MVRGLAGLGPLLGGDLVAPLVGELVHEVDVEGAGGHGDVAESALVEYTHLPGAVPSRLVLGAGSGEAVGEDHELGVAVDGSGVHVVLGAALAGSLHLHAVGFPGEVAHEEDVDEVTLPVDGFLAPLLLAEDDAPVVVAALRCHHGEVARAHEEQ